MVTYNVEDTVGFDVVVQPTVSAVVNAASGVDITLYMPGPQGPKGDPGATGPAGPAGSTLEPELTATDEAGIPLRINAFNGQLVDLTQWKSFDGKIMSNIAWDGSVFAPHVDAGRKSTKNMLTTNQSSLETDSNGWASAGSANGTVSHTTAVSYAGTGALAVTAKAAEANMQAATVRQPVVPGQVYTASAMVRAAAVSRNIGLSLIFRREDNSVPGSVAGRQASDNNEGWTQVEVSGQAPVDAKYVQVYFFVYNPSAAEVHYLDAASLRETPSANLVPNPDFEDGITGWSSLAAPATVAHSTASSYTGRASLAISPNGTGSLGAYSIISGGQVGKNYTISAWVYTQVSQYVFVTWGGLNGGATIPANTWTRLVASGPITTSDGTFAIRSSGTNSTFYADAVQLVVGDEPVDYLPPTTHNLLNNPSLEIDTSGWGFYSTAPNSVGRSTERSYVGTASYKATWTAAGNGGSYINRQVPPVVGQAYTGSVYINPSKTVGMVAAIEWYNSSGVRISLTSGPVISCAANKWTRISVSGTAPAGTASFVITFYGNGNVWAANDFCYFDAAQCELGNLATPYVDGSLETAKWDASENFITNSSFEIDTAGWEGLNKNLLTANQSSFETDLAGWQTNSGGVSLSRSTAQYLNGSASMAITATIAGSPSFRTLQGTNGVPVVPGQVYTATAHFRSGSSSRETYIFLRWYNSSGTVVSGGVSSENVADNSVGWTQVRVTGQAPATAAFVEVAGGINGMALNEAHYLDAVSLFETPSANLVVSPDFEHGTSGFVNTNNSTVAVSVTQSYAGRSSLQQTITGTGMASVVGPSKKFPVISGNAYSASAFVKTTNLANDCYINIVWSNSSGTTLSESPYAAPIRSTTTGWTRITNANIVAPTGAAFGQVRLIVATGGNEIAFWDGVQVVVGSSVIDYLPPTTHNLLQNSSFELDITNTNWSRYDNTNVLTHSVQTNGGYAGSNYFRVTGPVDANPTTAGVYYTGPQTRTNDIWYTLSFYARGVVSGTQRAFDVRWNNGPSVQEVISNPVITSSWQRYAFRIKWNGGAKIDPNIFITYNVPSMVGDPAPITITSLDFDAIQLEMGSAATPYVDGSLGAGYAWNKSENMHLDSVAEGTAGWYVLNNANTVTLGDTTQSRSGGSSVSWLSDAAGDTMIYSAYPGTTNDAAAPGIIPGATYTHSAYVFSPVATTAYMRIQYDFVTDGAISNGPSVPVPANTWTRVSHTRTCGPWNGVNGDGPEARTEPVVVATAASQKFYVDNAQVEQRTYATPYAQAGTAHAATSTRSQPWVLGGTWLESFQRLTTGGYANGALLDIRNTANPGYSRLVSEFGASTEVVVAPNTTYTLSAYRQAGQPVDVLDAGTGAVLGKTTGSGAAIATSRDIGTFTTGTNTTRVRVRVRTNASGSNFVGALTYLDAVQLEKRPYATTFESAGTAGLSTSTSQLPWVLGGLADATSVILPASTTERGLVIRGITGQNASLTEWQNDTGTVTTRIDANGHMHFRNAHILSNGAAPDAFYFRAGNHFFQTMDGSSTPLQINGGFNPTVVVTSTSAANPVLTVKGVVSQSADLQQWQNSAGGILATLNASGHMIIRNTNAGFRIEAAGVTNYLTAVANGTELFRISKEGATTNTQLVTNAGSSLIIQGGSSGLGALAILPYHQTIPGIIVRGATSQTADIQQWQNSGGAALANIRADGTIDGKGGATSGTAAQFIGVGTNTIGLVVSSQPNATAETIRVRAGASQSSDLTQWQDSTGTVLLKVASGGYLTAGGSHLLASSAQSTRLTLLVAQTATQNPLVVKATASQTADLTQWQNSAGTNLLRVLPDGGVVGPAWNINASGTISPGGAANTGNTSRLNVGLYDNNLAVGIATEAATNRGIVVRGALSQTADLTQWQATDGAVLASVGFGGYAGFGLAHDPATVVFARANNAGHSPLRARGFAGQVADLQQWQNSAGSNVASIAPNGDMLLQRDAGTSVGKLSLGNASHGFGRGSSLNAGAGTNHVGLFTAGGLESGFSFWHATTGNLLDINGSTKAIVAPGEFEITTANTGIILKSANGTRYRVTVSDAGALTVTAA